MARDNNQIVDKPIQEQLDHLTQILLKNPNIVTILEKNLFPNTINWYLGAGSICQSVWNYLSGKEITKGIKDYDLVYYDAANLSYEAEDVFIKKGQKLFGDLQVEIRNQARVHLWYEKHFGKKIEQFTSCEDAINTWPTTATAIGINKINGKINIYAPYGLNDLLGMVVKPNKVSVTQKVYEEKSERWKKNWPELKIIPWELI